MNQIAVSFKQVVNKGGKTVTAGYDHSMILQDQDDGSVWTAGASNRGQLGGGSGRKKFMRVIKEGAKAVTAGYQHSMVLMEDGKCVDLKQEVQRSARRWHNTDQKRFVQVIDTSATAVSAGKKYSMIVKEDGSVRVGLWEQPNGSVRGWIVKKYRQLRRGGRQRQWCKCSVYRLWP